MTDHGIPLNKAKLLSTLLEALLYGFSLLKFGWTIWVLLYQRSTESVNRKMVVVACSLLLLSTVHFVIDIIRIMQDVSQWTFVSKNYIYTAQTLISDGVVLYRCYAVWKSKFLLLPGLLWCPIAITGIGAPHTLSQVTQSGVFGGKVSKWITAFWVSAFATNLVATSLLAYRIWSIERKATRLGGDRESQLRPILHIIIDAGLIYSLILLAALFCFVKESQQNCFTKSYWVPSVHVTPTISITFYMVIIRVARANRAGQRMNMFSWGDVCLSKSSNTDTRSRLQVHITTLTENKVDNGRPVDPSTVGGENSLRGAEGNGEVEEVV